MAPLHELAIIWMCVFASAMIARHTRLTPVLYFLAFGSLMSNLHILPAETDPFIRGFADIGIVLIMFALGFEESSSRFVESIRRSWGIALFGAVFPFAGAYGVAWYFWESTSVALMCGLAMTATAVSLTLVSLRSAGLQHSKISTGIMTSAVLDDVASLALVAVLVPATTSDVGLQISHVLLTMGKAVLFFIIVAAVGLWIMPHPNYGWAGKIPGLNRIGIKHLLSSGGGEQATLTVLLLAVLIGLLAEQFGLHPAVGAYMAGLILKEEFFHFLEHPRVNYYQQTKEVVDNVAFSWIGPIFFVELGTKIHFEAEVITAIIPEIFTMTAVLILLQVASAALAARYTAGFNGAESVMVGIGMLGRAELAFVVLDIAYIQHAILSKEAFFTLMAAAFCMNVAVPLGIAWWKGVCGSQLRY